MVFLPSKSVILDDEILTNEWKTYYGMIRDYIAQMVGGDKAESITITEGNITPSKAFVLVDSENELEVDDIERINVTNFVDGNWICLTMANKDHAIVLKNGVDGDGAVYTYTETDEKLDYGEVVVLRLDGNVWRQVDISGYMRASADDLQTMTSTKKVATLAQLQPYIDNKSLAAVGLLAWAVRKPEGFVPCDNTQEYPASNFPVVKKMLDSGLLPSVTYDEYNSSVTSTGLCEKFGYNADSGKFYVPYLKAQVIQGTTYYPYICLYNSVTAQSLIDQQAILDEGMTLYNQMKAEFESFKTYVEQQMTAIATAVEGAVATVNTTRDEAVSTVNQTSTSAVNAVNNAATTAVQQVEDAYADFNTLYNEKTQGLITTANNQIVNINNASEENINKSRIWATGEDAEVETLEAGEHSSRGYADLSMAIANTPEDTPIDASTLVALDVIRGPRGYTGEKGAGLPTGGTTGQAVIKKSNADYDYEWANIQVDTSDCVKLTGTQTIAGEKIFTGDNASDTANLKIKNTTATLGTTPTSEKNVQLRLEDSSGDWTGLVNGKIKTDGSNCIELCVRKPDKSGSGFLSLNSSLDGNISLTASDGVKDSVKDWLGSTGGLEIGDIGFAPLGIDEAQNKRRYLNGQVISQAQFVSFTNKIKAAIQLTPSLATTETNWQAEVTNSKLGQCGKFVIDDALGTIRLPKVVNINGLQDLSLLGGIKDESLPNITGKGIGTANLGVSGAFYDYEVNGGLAGGSAANKIGFDASRSSSTYKDNAPVQQEAIQYPYFIQVATGVEESVDVSTEIQLNNPFFFGMHIWSDTAISNASWLISNGSYHSGATYSDFYQWLLKIHNGTLTVDGVSVKTYGASDITDYDYVINTADTTFRLPVKVKLASGSAVVGNGMTLGLTNGANNIGAVGFTNVGLGGTNNAYGQSVSPTGTAGTGITGNIGVTTDPTKSGIETSSSGLKLYFYVGETIQDANVINAAGVLTDIATLKGYDYVVESYRNGSNWYRIYKSGWVEQGGIVDNGSVGFDWNQVVTLLKAFSNTDYIVLTDCLYGSGGGQMSYHGQKTTSNFKIYQSSKLNAAGGSRYINWYACGQGE